MTSSVNQAGSPRTSKLILLSVCIGQTIVGLDQRALGLTSTAFHIGFLPGPSLGGFLIDTIGWRWIFYINMPFSLWGAYLAWKVIPETRVGGKTAIDIPGALLLLVTNSLFIYAID